MKGGQADAGQSPSLRRGRAYALRLFRERIYKQWKTERRLRKLHKGLEKKKKLRTTERLVRGEKI